MEQAVFAARKASEVILEVYAEEFGVDLKEDESPLTMADRRAHQTITALLEERFPGIPVLSEEGKAIPYRARRDWEWLWIVDPLDGTKEFVKRNGEFTVNIALVRNGTVRAGVVALPVSGEVYAAFDNQAWKLADPVPDGVADATPGQGLLAGARALPLARRGNGGCLQVVASRSHLNDETKGFVERLRGEFGCVDLVAAGSARKLCLIAEGTADVYPRFAPTMEWDTAAGQALVEAAGGSLVSVPDFVPLDYNRECLVNPGFLVVAPGRDPAEIQKLI